MTAERSWDDLVEQNERQEYGQAWLPDREQEHPSTLVGTVRGYDQGPVSEFTGEKPWICTVEARDGKLWSIWLNRAVLVGEFERHRPMPDERVVVRYRGQQKEASRQGAAPAHLYSLTVDRDRELPGFLTAPRLEAAERVREPERTGESDIPTDPGAFAYGQQRPATVDVPDADVVEADPKKEGDDDDDIPF